MVERDRRDASRDVSQQLVDVGYSLVQRERSAPAPSKVRSDLLAWGENDFGDFVPMVAVEIKNSSSAAGHQMALAHLSAQSAAFGTAVNLLYSDSGWLQADAGFTKFIPVSSPPPANGPGGVVRDPVVLRSLIESRIWASANDKRQKIEFPGREAMRELLNEVNATSGGMIKGVFKDVQVPADMFVREWLALANSSHGFFAEKVTDPSLSDAVARIASPRPGETILDPFVGFGGLLMATSSIATTRLQDCLIRGFDINEEALSVAQKLMMLAGLEGSVSYRDSTTEAWAESDVIVSAPPFGVRLNRGSPLPFGPVRELDVAAIGWATEALRPGGRAVLVTSRSWTFRGGVSAELRRWLSTAAHVSGLIGLPRISKLNSLAPLLVVIDKEASGETIVADLVEDWQDQLAPGSELSQLLQRPLP